MLDVQSLIVGFSIGIVVGALGVGLITIFSK